MSIFEELFKASGSITQRADQNDASYITQVLKAISALPETKWDRLSIKSREWFNEAAKAVSTSKPLPPCPGFKEQQIKEAEQALEVIKKEEKKLVTQQKEKKKKVVTGVMDAIRKIVLQHPDWTSRHIHQHLKENGFPNVNLNTVTIDGGNIKRVIILAQGLGLWKNNDPIETDETTEEAIEVASS